MKPVYGAIKVYSSWYTQKNHWQFYTNANPEIVTTYLYIHKNTIAPHNAVDTAVSPFDMPFMPEILLFLNVLFFLRFPRIVDLLSQYLPLSCLLKIHSQMDL